MAKAIKKIKLQIPGGKATPAPPVGTVLGPAGVNIGDFVNKFNEQTRDQMGVIIPVEMTVYDDRTFTFVLKVSPMSRLILKALGVDKGSGKTPLSKVGNLSKEQVRQIAETKMPDLTAGSIEAAERMVEGTAKSMGVTVGK
ncbi:50S ribosomal protein L11 [Patescibacteria group bacterium]|nr:50S ribosomal protein L11 [Patescibacteria group bacterium]MBU1500665.1 50S ribosomal protein L11 [Patescibacteria group bacterium]MBU2080382.1 50S ribosomal protein L11 [Patescibacteria group bacterium]MBU2124206.1 50S ribosomal protein L11 [Patescibacteria group bacterium]MBU2194343.1 50S ribosomal protein L11 [Patescibacteria group bacterium]